MEKIIVRGGNRLSGTVQIEGAKNSVLPVLAATLLASKGKCVIKDVPTLSDVFTINEVLRNLNADVTFDHNVVTVDAQIHHDGVVPELRLGAGLAADAVVDVAGQVGVGDVQRSSHPAL